MAAVRRSSVWLLSVFAVLLFSIAGTVVYYLQLEFPDGGPERSNASNLGFFLLININIIVVMVLVFLVSKNIITLFLDRKRKILGSRLRSRLVGAFVVLSLVPTVLLFLVAKGILESVLQGWFSPQIAASVDGSLAVARFHYDEAESQLARNAAFVARKFDLLLGAKQSDFPLAFSHAFLEEKLGEYGLDQISVIDQNGKVLVTVDNPSVLEHRVSIPPVNTNALHEAFGGKLTTRAELSLDEEFLRTYAPIAPPLVAGLETSQRGWNEAPNYVVVTTRWINPKLASLLSSVLSAYEDYKELRTYRRPLASSYLLTLIVVTLLIVFAAVWVGFYLARGLTVPLGILAEATSQVAHGNLDYQIPEVGDDELSLLVRSFNTMTGDLKHTTEELVARRRYMETVFANVAVGVIPIDTEFRVAAINLAAADILAIYEPNRAVNRPIDAVLPAELARTVRGIGEELYGGEEKVQEGSLSLEVGGKSKHFQFTVTKLTDEGNRNLGLVLLLDDITELVSAQRMAAWREVARRIAHEIKNPLTPIQLSAQRIQRRFSSRHEEASEDMPKRGKDDQAFIADATSTIVQQVENLRTLVNEFSRFARMPKSSPRLSNFNDMVSGTVTIFRDAHPHIRFELDLEQSLPMLEIDPEQMARALINLLDNAISAVSPADMNPDDGTDQPPGVITVSTRFDSQLGLATLSVADNGPGVPEADKTKLFEPYFSTKRGGTGLGLAIVSSIVTDHNGFIRVKANYPRGAVFTIELPAPVAGQKQRANQA